MATIDRNTLKNTLIQSGYSPDEAEALIVDNEQSVIDEIKSTESSSVIEKIKEGYKTSIDPLIHDTKNVLAGTNILFNDILKQGTRPVRNTALRIGGPAVGAAGGAALTKSPGGAFAGSEAGVVVANSLDATLRYLEGDPIPPGELAANTGIDAAFAGLGSTLGAIRNIKPTIKLTTEQQKIVDTFLKNKTSLHPFQVLKDRGKDLFKKGPVSHEQFKQLSDFISGKGGQLEKIDDIVNQSLAKAGIKEASDAEITALTNTVGKNIAKKVKDIGVPFEEARKLYGNTRVGTKELVDNLTKLKNTLQRTNVEASQIVGNAIDDINVMGGKTKTFFGKELSKIRSTLRKQLKEKFINIKTSKLSEDFHPVAKILDSTFDKIETKAATFASKHSKGSLKAPDLLKQGRALKRDFEELIKDLGGNDIERAIREAGLDITEFADTLAKNPNQITDIFLKSKNPGFTLETVTKLGGKEGKKLIEKQFPSKILSSSEDVLKGQTKVNTLANNIGKKYKDQFNVLYGEKANKELIKTAQDVDLMKSTVGKSGDDFARKAESFINPDLARNEAGEVATNIGRAGLPGQVGGVVGIGIGQEAGKNIFPENQALGRAVGGLLGYPLGAAGGQLFGLPLIRALSRASLPRYLDPLSVTTPQGIKGLEQGSNLFDLLIGSKVTNPGSLFTGTAGVGLESKVKDLIDYNSAFSQ